VYLHAVATGVPRTFLNNLKHNKVVHDCVIFLTVLTEEVPSVPDDDRAEIIPLGDGFWRIIARYGFTEQPNVPTMLGRVAPRSGCQFHEADATYFVGSATIISSPKPGMARWREHLFGVMMRNAHPVTDYFGLNPNRLVELGAQVEI
jgi:KUP system potassium uptake protein